MSDQAALAITYTGNAKLLEVGMIAPPPCRHFHEHHDCSLEGRKAPRDCICAAYDEDLAAALSLEAEDQAKVQRWSSALLERG